MKCIDYTEVIKTSFHTEILIKKIQQVSWKQCLAINMKYAINNKCPTVHWWKVESVKYFTYLSKSNRVSTISCRQYKHHTKITDNLKKNDRNTHCIQKAIQHALLQQLRHQRAVEKELNKYDNKTNACTTSIA